MDVNITMPHLHNVLDRLSEIISIVVSLRDRLKYFLLNCELEYFSSLKGKRLNHLTR